MSEGQHGPSYLLYGVICHAGGGPNSGHYYAHVKASDGRWYEMNDDSVSPNRASPAGLKSAYILLYIRDRGQALEAAVTNSSNHPPIAPKMGIVAAMKKRRVLLSDDEDDEDKGVTAPRPFIGPLLPSQPPESDATRQVVGTSDPQANLVKKKIEAVSKKPVSTALSSLSQYGESEDEGEKEKPKLPSSSVPAVLASPISSPLSSPPLPPPSSSSPARSPITIPPIDFYGSSRKQNSEENEKKRKSSSSERDENLKDYARTPLRVDRLRFSSSAERSGISRRFSSGANPYGRLTGGNNLRVDRPPPNHRYGGRRKRYII
jgi:ubiquitin carboxyl-terminal hydrolase 36/42